MSLMHARKDLGQCSARMMKLQITLIIMSIWMLSLNYGHQNGDDYVDPTDLINFDPVNVRMKMVSPQVQSTYVEPSLNVEIPLQSESLEHCTCSQNRNAATFQECPNIINSLESCTSLFRQYVNKLVHVLEPKVGKASSPVEINLRLRVSYHDIFKLRTFGEGDLHEIHDVHETLSYMIQYSSDVLQPESAIYWLERKIGISFGDLMQILIVIFSILISLTMLPRINISRNMLSGALLLTFVVSVIFTWIEMYQKEVAHQEKILMTNKLSDSCPKIEELSLWSRLTTYISLTFTFDNEKCKEHFKAMLVNPFVKVSPLEAVAVAIVKTIITPLEIIGIGIKKFFIGLLMDVPVQYQLFLIIVVSAFVVLTLFFYCRYNLKVFGLISLGPSETQHSIQERTITPSLVHDNRVKYEIQQPFLLRPNRLESQVVVSESPPNTAPVPVKNTHEGCYNSNGCRFGAEKVQRDLNDLNTVEKTNGHKHISVNNTRQTDDLTSGQVSQIEDVHFAVGASLREEHLKNSTPRQNDESENVNTEQSLEVLSKQIKHLTVANATLQEEESETHLTVKMKSVSISAEIDTKDLH